MSTATHYIELYEVTTKGVARRWCTGSRVVNWQGAEYVPAPVKRGTLTTESSGRAKVSLTIPPTAELVARITSAPVSPTRVSILRWTDGEELPFAIFRGRVTAIQLSEKGRALTAQCSSGSPMLEARTPRLVYSSYCQHDLFDAGCGLLDADWMRTAIVSAVDGGAVTSVQFGALPSGWLTRGRLVVPGDEEQIHLITDHTESQVRVLWPGLLRLEYGQEVHVYPGCDGAPETCRTKFANLTPKTGGRGYLGMPYIPDSNPCIWGFK